MKTYVIKNLRIGSKLLNKHSGEVYVVVSKSAEGFKLIKQNGGLPTSELKKDMGRYFKKIKK